MLLTSQTDVRYDMKSQHQLVQHMSNQSAAIRFAQDTHVHASCIVIVRSNITIVNPS